MKMLQKTVAVSLALTALLAITGCSSDDGGSGGTSGGESLLASGGFIKEIAKGGTIDLTAAIRTSLYHSQHLILSESIGASGNIKSISFRSSRNTDENTCPNITVKLGETGLSELTDTFADNIENGKGTLKIIVDGELTIPAVSVDEFFTITLDEPVYYNGVDNLVLDVTLNEGCTELMGIRATGAAVNTVLTSSSLTSVTGSLIKYTQNIVFDFKGGVNTQLMEGPVMGDQTIFAEDGRAQVINMAEDINGSGPITGIAYQVAELTTASEQNITIRLGHTTLDEFESSNVLDENYVGSAVTVSENVVLKIPAGLEVGEWFWIPLMGHFNYNGTDNLIVDIQGLNVATTINKVQMFSSSSNTLTYSPDGVDSTGAFHYQHNIKFRFNGATMDVLTAENSSWSAPFSDSYDVRTQMLYGSYALGTGGEVTTVSFRLKDDSLASEHQEATIVLGNTAITSLDDNLSKNIVDSKNVFSGTMQIPAGLKAGDWVDFPVSGFTYDPTKNLVLEVTTNASSVGNINRILTTDDPVLVGGVKFGDKGSNIAKESIPGQADLRIMLDK